MMTVKWCVTLVRFRRDMEAVEWDMKEVVWRVTEDGFLTLSVE